MALITVKFLSKVLALPVDVTIAMPDYDWMDNPIPEYPVLYLLHGFAGDHSDFLRFTSIERYAWQKNVIVVMPSGYNSAYTDMRYGEDYFTYISAELPKYLSNVLSIPDNPQHTYVCGVSMGGYGAFKWGMTYPDRFNGIISLSGSLHVEDRLLGRSRNVGRQLNGMYGDPPIIDSSTQDVFTMFDSNIKSGKRIPNLFFACAEDDKEYLRNATHDMFELAKKNGIDAVYIKGFGGHGYNYWDPILPQVLDFCK